MEIRTVSSQLLLILLSGAIWQCLGSVNGLLSGRGHGCCYASSGRGNALTTNNYLGQKVHSVTGEKPWIRTIMMGTAKRKLAEMKNIYYHPHISAQESFLNTDSVPCLKARESFLQQEQLRWGLPHSWRLWKEIEYIRFVQLWNILSNFKSSSIITLTSLEDREDQVPFA